MRIVRPMVRTVGGVPKSFRDIARLQEITRVLVRHGLGMLVRGLPGVPPVKDRRLRTTPDRITRALQELGPTFVKLGQVLSTRPDLLPDRYTEALQTLQDDVLPCALDDIHDQLSDQLGSSWRDAVEWFDEQPLATASIAQVHRATLKDGSRVVFKVQRPHIQKTIQADLRILNFLARRALHEYPEARSFDPRGVLHEFEASLGAELDFLQEADHMRRFTELFLHKDFVHIPVVYPHLTTRRILCMEYLDGVKMRGARAAGCDMKRVGDRYLEMAYDMLFLHGYFHGDLHPGNVVVMEGDVLGVLDFGMVGRLTEEMRTNIVSILFALQRGDYRTIARLFYDIAIKDRRVDYRSVERDTIEVMEKHWGHGSIRDMQMGRFVMDLAGKAAMHGARVPQAYTMFFKAIVTTEGLAKTLVEEIDPISAAQPYFQRMLQERMSIERLEQDAFYSLLTMGSLVGRLPVSLVQFLDDVDDQRVVVNVRNRADPAEQRARDRLGNRIITAGFTITCVLAGTWSLDQTLWGVPFLSIAFYLLAFPFFVLTTWMALRNRGRE